MSYTSLRRRHAQLSIVTTALALILTAFVAWGCYLFFQSSPAAGIGAAVVGVLVVAIGYLSWGVCGECLARRWYPSAFFVALVSLTISGIIMFVIHQTILHSSQQQQATAQASEVGQAELMKQLEIDRSAYQSLLAPVPPVLSEERAGLQDSIRDLQEQSRIKRAKNFDRPADRIDDSVLKLQERLAELVQLDAAASDRSAKARSEQAAALQQSIHAREQMLANKPVFVVSTLSEQMMLTAAVLIELITSGMMLYLARQKAVLDAPAEAPEVKQEAVAPSPAAAAPVAASVTADQAVEVRAPVISISANLDAPEEPAPQAATESTPIIELEITPEPVTIAPQAAAEQTELPAAIDPAAELLASLKSHERQRYEAFQEHVRNMPADQPIKTDAVASALGFGKDLVSTFFKIAGHQEVLQKQGRQWFLYVAN